MTTLKQRASEFLRDKWASTGLTVVIMAAVVIALGVGQGTTKAIVGAALLAATLAAAWVFAHFWHRDDDLSNIIAGRADERQQQIEHEANYVAGRVAVVACAAATIVQLGRGEDPWPYAQIFMASGIGYFVALVSARFRG